MKRKKYTKLILTMVITIMLSCLLAISVSAGDVFDSGTCGENVTWTLTNGGTLYISGTGEMERYSSSSQVPWDKYRSLIQNVVIIEGVTRIDSSMALTNCTNVTSITIPESVTSIRGFSSCSNLIAVYVDENNAYYSADANGILFNKTQTELICYPAGKTDTAYTIPATVTRIGANAFYRCSSLTSITIPQSVISIGSYVFTGCSSLREICVDEGNPNYSVDANGVLFNKTQTELICYPAGKPDTAYTLPSTVTNIGWGAFYRCSNLTSITIPEGVTSIGSSAFYGCSSLASVTIPESVTSIGAQAFSFCRQLTKAEILTQTATFGSGVFNYTHTDFTIHGYAGSTAQTYAAEKSHPFELFDAIASGVCGENVTWTLSNDYVLFVSGKGAMTDWEEETSIPWYNYRENITNVVVYDGITSIGNGAFKACPNLIKAEIFSMDVTFGTDVFQGAHADFVLCGYLGSTADTYAEQCDITFYATVYGARNVMSQAAWIDSVNLDLGSYGFVGYGTPTTPYRMIDGLWAVGPNHKYEGLNTDLIDETQYYNVDGVADENGEYLWFATFELSSMYTVDSFMMYFIDLASLGVGVDNTLPWLPRSLDILVSETGENGSWKVVYQGSDLHTDTDPGAYAYHKATDSKLAYYDLSAVFSEAADAKYIRVASRSTSTDTVSIAAKWINISELEVYSKDNAVQSGARPSVILYPTYSPAPNDGNIMTSSSFVECVNVDVHTSSDPAHMIDGVWAVGPTHHEDGFNGRVDLYQWYDADNQLSETGEYLWTVTFELDRLRRVGSFRLINMDITGSDGGSAMVQWLQRSFDILVSETGEAGSWTVAYTGRTLHNEYSLGAYVYHEATDSKLAYYDLAADFGQWYNARYIKFASRDETCDMLTTRNWFNISELEVYETAIGVCGENLDWELTEDGALTISGNGSMANQMGSNFGEPFAGYRSCIKTVSIGDGVTDIRPGAFRYCYNLTSITIPESVTSIGDSAFKGCDSLTIYGYAGSAAETYAAENNIPFVALRELISITSRPANATYNIGDTASPLIVTATVSDSSKLSYQWYCTDTEDGEGIAIEGATFAEYVPSTAVGGTKYYYVVVTYTYETSTGPVTATATSEHSKIIVLEKYSSYTYIVSDGKATIVDIDNNAVSGGTIVIPSTLGGYPVTEICGAAFSRVSPYLYSVSIPETVEKLDCSGFMACMLLEGVYVNDKNPNYSSENGVLFNKEKNTLVFFPTGHPTAEYVVPSSVTRIGLGAFWYCKNLTSVTIPDSVVAIDESAFYNNEKLSAIYVDEENTNFTSENGVLFNADKTCLIAYPNAKTDSVYIIPDGVASIGEVAFYSCDSLTSITIPESVTSIGDSAFESCDNLTIYGYTGSTAETYAAENDIPFEVLSSVAVIASGEFGADGDNLTWVLYDDGELVIRGTGEMENWTSNSAPWYSYRTSIQSVVIEEGVTSVGRYAFFGCINLTSVTLSEGITYIGTYAFTYCSRLTQLHIPASVTTIEDKTFLICESMESFTVGEGSEFFSAQDGVLFNADKTKLVRYPQAKAGTTYTIPDTVTTIGDDAFYIATKLETVHITANVSSIEPNAFNACSSLTVITVDENNQHFMADEGGVLFTKDEKTLYRYPQAKAGATYTVPDGVTTIRFNAFARCTYLEELILPADVAVLEEQSFAMANTMQKLTVLNPNATFGINLFWRRSASAATIYGYAGSTAETYATTNSMPFEAIPANIDEPTIPAPTGATVTAPEGGWKEGENTFSVTAQFTCMVIVSQDGGKTFTRLEATPNADGSYSFTADISPDVIVNVAIAGDTNNNGELTTADINRLRAAFLGKIALDNYTSLITDINGDGKITTADVNRLRAVYLGKTTLPWN